MRAARFAYLRDPLCVTGCLLYAINRWLVGPHVSSEFLHGQFNDLFLIPCALPVILWIQRKIKLRAHDHIPTLPEIAMHLGVWTIIAEYIGPYILHKGIADWRDVAAYTFGAIIAATLWRQRSKTPDPAPAESGVSVK